MPLRFTRAILHLVILGLLPGGTVACGQDTGRKQLSNAVEQRDSAGIVIVETPGVIAQAPIGWIVGEAPDMELGGPTREGPEQFDRIGGRQGGITGSPNRGIVVVDAGSGELRFFDGEGRFLNVAGGMGDGPGEFRDPKLVPYVASDSVLIFDARHRRFTLFSSDGKAYRSFPLEALPKTRVIGRAHGASESGILMTRGVLVSPVMDDMTHSTPIDVVWVSLVSDRDEFVAQFHDFYFATMLREIPIGLDVPFIAEGATAIGANGFFVADGGEPEVHEFDTSGRLVRIFRIAEVRRPVTLEDVESAIGYLSTRFRVSLSEARRYYERMDAPDVWPSFKSIRVDRLGWIWAERFNPYQDTTQHWTIFDTTGSARGTLELPGGLEVHDIGSDYVLGRWRDDLGIEHVRRYRLERR